MLKRNPNAVQIGLTATPRKLAEVKPAEVPDQQAKVGADQDLKILADNIKYFGEPVYEYLAACEIIRRDIFLDQKPQNERQTGIARSDLGDKTLTNAITGQPMTPAEAKDAYEAPRFEAQLVLPERVREMCKDLFEQFLKTGGPLQKTVIFCARDSHADAVAAAMGSLYAEWCAQNGQSPVSDYAFKCAAASKGAQYLADLREASQSHFIATTVDLLTTGVDVPAVRGIVFFKYVQSPIAFYQMVGRGTRLHPPTGKLMFRVYDYTDATRLFGEDFITRPPQPPGPPGPNPPPPPKPIIQVRGFDVRVTDAGHLILTQVDGKAVPVTVEEYKQRLAAKLVEEAPTLEQFRDRWINPALRHTKQRMFAV